MYFTVAEVPESYHISVGSGWAGKRHPDVSGEYHLYDFEQKCVDDGILIYKHTDWFSRLYLLNLTDSWIVVYKMYGEDLWDGDILLKRPINQYETSLIAPEDGWYFSHDAVGGKKYIQDTGIRVALPSTHKAVAVVCSLFGLLATILLFAFAVFKIGLFPGFQKSLIKQLERIKNGVVSRLQKVIDQAS